MMFKISLQEIGRNKHSEVIEWETATWTTCEVKALDEVSKHLMSSEIELDDEGEGVFGVWVGGMRKVGKVKIEEMGGLKV